MEENAFPLMSFQGVDRHSPSVGKSDVALEHRRWLEFGLGTDAKTLAPLRQGEGDSRIMKEFPKNHGFFGTPFFHIFRRDTKDMAPGGRFSLRSGELVLE